MQKAERCWSAQALPCIQKVQLLHPAAQQADGDTLITNGSGVEGVYKPPHALLNEGLALSTGERLEGGCNSVLWQLLGPGTGAVEAQDVPKHDTAL